MWFIFKNEKRKITDLLLLLLFCCCLFLCYPGWWELKGDALIGTSQCPDLWCIQKHLKDRPVKITIFPNTK